METNQKHNLVFSWFVWHFYEMPDFLIQVWKNYILFGLNYFSLPLLFKTFFSPWRRYNWKYPPIFQVGEFFNALVSNVFSRILGFIMRVVLIISGILVEIFIIVAGAVVILFWLLIPIIIMGGLLFIFI